MSVERFFTTLGLRLRSIFRRGAAEAELDEELEYHLERQVQEHVARGMDPGAARTAALRALGGVERRKDEMRDQRRLGVAENLVRDARYAVRALARSPGFTAVAVITLALGIGANTAIFTVVNAVLFRPLPYGDPERLVGLHYPASTTVAPATFFDWQASTTSFSQMGLAEYWTPSLAGTEKPEQLTGLHVSASLLPMLAVPPLLGRVFGPDEEHDGRQHVVVLRYDLWKTRFGGDSAVIGRAMQLDGESYTIVGVMPAGFMFAPYWATEAKLWSPLVLDARRTDRNGASLRVFARLRPGVSVPDARTQLGAVAARLEREYPGTNQHVTLSPLRDMAVGDVRESLLILLAAVGVVLLIACANVAHLQLMRAAAREREFALRAAMGGSRGRLIQQSLVESGILALAGGLLGIGLASLGVRLLVALGPKGLPRIETIALDGSAFAFMLVVAVLSAVVFGLAPALAASRADLHGALKEGGRGAGEGVRRRRLRAALVVSEFGMALVLLAGAGLVLRSFGALMHADPGFVPARVLSVKVSVKGTADEPRARRLLFYRDLVERVRAVPGVEAASAINHLPLIGDDWNFPYAAEGAPLPRPGESPHGHFLVVRPGYFATMRIPLVLGRDFTADDELTGAKVVIVSEAMAAKQWPGRGALGGRISVDDAATHPDWFTVVGVAHDVRQGSWAGDDGNAMYFPSRAGEPYPWKAQPLVTFLNPDYMTLVIRTTGAPAAIGPAVESVVRALNPEVAVSQVLTMDQAIEQELVSPKFYLILLAGFAGVALALAAVGVYGVISYSVTRRTHEIGVRLALGAGRGEAFALVVRQGMRLAVIGTAVGLVVALPATRYLRALLYGVSPSDPLTFVVVTAVLAVVALVACCIPARRASRIDPMTALRCD